MEAFWAAPGGNREGVEAAIQVVVARIDDIQKGRKWLEENR